MKRQRPLIAVDNPLLKYIADLEDENALSYKALELVRAAAAVDPHKTKSLVLLSNYARDILAIVDKLRASGSKPGEAKP